MVCYLLGLQYGWLFSHSREMLNQTPTRTQTLCFIFIRLCTRIHVYVGICQSHGLGQNTIKSESMFINRHVLPRGQCSQAVSFLCSGGDVARWDALSGWLLMTVFRAGKKTYHPPEENVGFLIRFVFRELLSTFWAHSLNGAGWFREHIDAINSSVVLGDRVNEQRWEGDEPPRRSAEMFAW